MLIEETHFIGYSEPVNWCDHGWGAPTAIGLPYCDPMWDRFRYLKVREKPLHYYKGYNEFVLPKEEKVPSYDEIVKLQNTLDVEAENLSERASDLRAGVRLKWSLKQLRDQYASVKSAADKLDLTLKELEKINPGGERNE